MRRRLAIGLLAFALCGAQAWPANIGDVRALDGYLQSLQLPDGALANSNAANAAYVTPYKGAYAAIGLALAGDANTALGFDRWYASHVNARNTWGPGCTIDDFTFTRQPYEMHATGTAGAMDAPAGVFLTALRYLYETGDATARAWLADQEARTQCIAEAAFGLYQPAFHCTQAIVGYDFCLTEDNFEVWRGLGDLSWLEENAWHNPKMAAAYAAEQYDIGIGLSEMWDAQRGTYNWARHIHTGVFTHSAWTQFYPGAVTQLWPVIVGYAQPDDPRSIALWRNFTTHWPTVTTKSPVDSPWPWNAIAAARMGDTNFVTSYDDCLNADYASKGYPYQWESADGGNMMTALLLAQKSVHHTPFRRRLVQRRPFCIVRL